MQDEAAKLRETLVDKKELDGVKNYLTGTEAIGLQNQGELAQRLALAVLYGEGFEVVFNRRERLEKLDAAQIQAAAKKYMDAGRWAKAIVKPK
jgi:predicted Zn-dependent peptidase